MHRGLTLRLPSHKPVALQQTCDDHEGASHVNDEQGGSHIGPADGSYPSLSPTPNPVTSEQADEPESFDQRSEPIILLDSKRLAGYLPNEGDQAKSMIESLRKALFGDKGLYREEMLMDLFATKKAKHGLRSGESIQNESLEMPYPKFLREHVSTSEVWNKLNDPHEIPVVQRVLEHLVTCQQPLLWKFDMKREILRIVEEEMSFRELEGWKKRRSVELEQLYMVRETIDHRVKMAEEEEACLLKERDQAVVEQMKKRAGLTSFDLHSTVFCFPDDADNGIMGFAADGDANYFGKEEEHSDEGNCWTQSRADDNLHLQEKEHADKLREATDVENSVLEECTSSALRVAMAKVAALNKKLEEVDELLESLQDEEWAEGDEEDDGNQLTYPHPRDSVLTPILAMVLGSSELLQTALMREHREIVEAWEVYFGRLPPIPSEGSKNELERENLGIVENEGDWEDLDDSVVSEQDVASYD